MKFIPMHYRLEVAKQPSNIPLGEEILFLFDNEILLIPMCLPVLNLLNFELPVASRSNYVLTSPRSLKACRKAGIKPIELLYKSLAQVESEVLNVEDATVLFEAYEEERQRKLAVCRSLRNELLIKGIWSREQNVFIPENNELHRRFSTSPEITCWKAVTLENLRKSKLYHDSSKTAMSLPKVNVMFNRNATGRLQKELSEQDKENSEECSLHSPTDLKSEDVNNINISKKHLTSTTKRKLNHSKKYSKILDHKKAFQNVSLPYADPDYCIYKYKQLIKNSVNRYLRELDVQKTQRELDHGMEKWQDRVCLLQWLDSLRALEQASREIERKVERLQQKNRSRSIIHTMNINKVKEAQEMKAEDLRRQVEEKKRKIFNLEQEKNRIIFESKNRALTIQELKEHIRNIETPETFDQKVAKLSMNKKVLDSHMSARTMQKSHIWLG